MPDLLPIAAYAALVLVSLGAIALGRRQLTARAQRIDGLTAAARELSLEFVPPDLFGNGAGLHGTLKVDAVSGLEARVDAALTLHGLEVVVEARIPADLRLIFPLPQNDEHNGVRGDSGDRAFDDAVWTDGGFGSYPVLDAKLRAQTLAFTARAASLVVDSGRLIARAPSEDTDPAGFVRGALDLAAALSQVPLAARHLADLASSEPVRVRRSALASLLLDHPDTADARRAGQALAGAPHVEDGGSRLLARLLAGAGAAELVGADPAEFAHDVGQLGGVLGAAAVRRIATSGASVATLLAILGAAKDPVVRTAILSSVGDRATVETIPELHRIAAKAPDGETRDAAEQAIASIRARLGNVEAGDLSLADAGGAAGDVSLAGGEDAEKGRVSLTASASANASPLKR